MAAFTTSSALSPSLRWHLLLSRWHHQLRGHCHPLYAENITLIALVFVVCHLVMYRTKGTYAPYNGTFGAPDQGETLDVCESQTTGSALRWLALYPSTSYSWSCSWSYSWSYSWTHVLGTKTMTSLILDHVVMSYLYLGTGTEIKICSWNCLRTRLW
jgi:hypothetical protein